MKAAHEKALSVLAGLRIRAIGRAADLLWVQFGEWRTVPCRSGGTKQVGQWALHVQTSWRFAQAGRILLGLLDLYATDDAEATAFDWNKDGQSRFDRIASGLNERFRNEEVVVEEVMCDAVGSVTLRLGGGLVFAIFPNGSSDYPEREFWRLFAPSTDGPHYVVETSSL